MKLKPILFGVVAMLATLLSLPVTADDPSNGPVDLGSSTALAVPVDGGWQLFTWNTTVSDQVSDNPFTFTLAGPGLMKITDAFIDGDRFRVRLNGNILGDTSAPTDNGDSESDLDAAFADPRWSSGVWIIPAGMHSVDIQLIETATGFTGGGAAIRVDSGFQGAEPVPTLNSWMLLVMLLTIALLGLVSVRQRQKR